MKSVTTHQAKTHLSRLLKEVQAGEEIVILSATVPVARLTAIQATQTLRPKVGTPTSAPVSYTEDAFRPLDADELREWGI